MAKAKAKPVIAPRKPPSDERDQFVAQAPGRSSAQAPGRSVAQAPGRSGARMPIVRADGRELRKLHVYVTTKTAKALALHCAQEDRDQSSVIEEAVTRFLESGGSRE